MVSKDDRELKVKQVEQEGWWLGKVCPMISKDHLRNCIASRCVCWDQVSTHTPYEGDKIRIGRCTYGRD